ncbi:PEP/pyruvate-binding domain-containing protein, partial [bacterium]|nr:PEP/pyruvate-binding domain-containing protein [bacterium]
LIGEYEIEHRMPGIAIHVPPTTVVATDIFERFMESNDLSLLALSDADDDSIRRAFLEAELPKETRQELRVFLERVTYPLAVRSSSLLEDSSYQPFAGIYQTYMLPNSNADIDVRLEELCRAIRLVYASTYCADSKSYIDSTPNRLEDERMAVVVQQLAGRRHGDYVYPDIAGVARSYDYYPVKGLKPEDGVASAVLGLGRMVVDGGRCVRFSPTEPRRLFQFSSTETYLENAQREFYALDMAKPAPVHDPLLKPDSNIALLDLGTAMEHDTLAPVGSVYSPENDRVYEGVYRDGVRLVTMAGVLSGDRFPLPKVLSFLLEIGQAGFSTHIEIEFAVNLSQTEDAPHEFTFLQIRPLVFDVSTEELELAEVHTEDTICVSGSTLGHGQIKGIRDIVFVRPDVFDRAKTVDVADEVGQLNRRLRSEGRPYLLIGPGRWGSADPWLGVPVSWSHISGVRCIVETQMEGITVEPSQGTHFFQNITSFGIGYFTMGAGDAISNLDHDWLMAQVPETETEYVRHLQLPDELEIIVNSRSSFGVIMKPAMSVLPDRGDEVS